MAKFIFRRDEMPGFQITEKEIRGKIVSDLTRRTTFAQRKDILRDNIKPIIDNLLSQMFALETYQDMRPYIDASNNVMRRILRETSVVYKDEPARIITPKSAQKIYGELTETINLNDKMARANYLLNGLNDLILQVVILGDELDINILTPDMVTVFQNEDNPTVLDAIMIEDSYYNDQYQPIRQWIYWSPTRHFIVDDEYKIRSVEGNEGLENPYASINIQTNKFYPFVDVHASDRENEYWDQYTGNDLVEATKLIAVQSTFRNFMIPMQFKQIAVQMTGVDEGKMLKSNQIKSPLHIMTANGQMQVLDWQSNLSQLGQEIQNQVFGIATNYGISAENFKLTAQATSGFARLIARERLDEIREEQVKVWRKVEEEVFDTVRTAGNLYGLGSIPESAKFSIDFAEPRVVNDPIAEVDLIKQRMQLGLLNLLDVIKKENPDIKTDEQAEEYLNQNIEIRDRLSRRFGFNFDELLKPTGQAVEQPRGIL